MGKKQLGELQPSELVTTIIVSNIATLSLEEPNIPLTAGVVPILAIVCLDVFMSAVTLKSGRIRKFITGSPRVIISGGEIDQSEMRNLRYTIDDVLEAMRDAGIFNVFDVQYAIAETTGKINFFAKHRAFGEGELRHNDPHSVIIKDGEVDCAGVAEVEQDAGWLERVLGENGVKAKEIFLMTADRRGGYNLVRKK